MIKKIIKKIFNYFNLKIVKINVHKPIKHPYPVPTKEEIELIQNSKGILHIGGHRGTEAAVYDWFNKGVLWIEADPNIFKELEINIEKHYNQKAICALLGDVCRTKVPFYISNNDGACSSVFQFSDEVIKQKLWSDRNFFTKNIIYLNMMTLDEIVKKKKIDIKNYDFWIMDIQGAEMLALKGARESLNFCKSIQIEISQKNYYQNGAKWLDIKNFLELNKFTLTKEPLYDHTEVLFIKK